MACVMLQRAINTRMCLANLEKMPASEKLALLMKDVGYPFNCRSVIIVAQVEVDHFADHFQQYTTPFLQRQEGHHPGTSEQLLTDYLCAVAKHDLGPCLCIFTTAHTEVLHVTVLFLTLSVTLNCLLSGLPCESLYSGKFADFEDQYFFELSVTIEYVTCL